MDAELKGFGVVVSQPVNSVHPNYTFFVQRMINARTVRVKIGRLGEISADEARKRAQIIIADMLKGVNPNEEKVRKRTRGVTLSEAASGYRNKPSRRSRTQKSDRTIVNHDHYFSVLGAWSSRPLSEITRSDVLAMHKMLTRTRGQVAANNSMRWFRSVYNSAMLIHESLPQNPCVVLSEYWNRERRKRSPIPWEQLPEWGRWVNGELRDRNPVRADLQLFLLFSGLRRTDACTIEVREVSVPLRKVFRPRPKGGEDRAYDMPMSNVLLDILTRRIRDNNQIFNADCRWVFPAFDKGGRIGFIREPKEEGRPSPHRLRDTYATAAHEAGVARLDQKILMNHVLSDGGDVTEGYQRPSWNHIVLQQERISAFLGRMLGDTKDLLVGANWPVQLSPEADALERLTPRLERL